DVTPFAQVGGEPFRIGALSPWLGAQRATGSVVTYYMLHAMSNMVVWLAGIVLVLALYHPPTPLVVPLLVALVLITLLIAFVFTRHQQGIVAPLVRFFGKVPLAGRLARRIEARSSGIEALDRTITGFYHASPGRFWLALLLDTLGRFVSMFEYWLVARAISVEMSVLQAVVISSFSALATNVIFFMPLQAGSKEGGLYFAFKLAGLDPTIGIFAALVQRVREWTWIGVGLLLIWLAGERVDRGSNGVTV
ncbi:MAG: lysylphosphatidylglycerol synthase domain-containing protein, partial [Gemmatimonadales bacterium]